MAAQAVEDGHAASGALPLRSHELRLLAQRLGAHIQGMTTAT